MVRITQIGYFFALIGLLSASRVFGQGETTSAIVGQVSDAANAALPGVTVTITNRETGATRTAKTGDTGRFDFPQLKPGLYSVRAEMEGFQPQRNDNVFSGLGQKQTVDFRLKIAQARETVEVSSEPPVINPEDANTSTNLNAPALEDLPNPGGDMTYPLQFAPGALINTAGSGNDFVGGTNGYGNVQFNGLPALSNGYIVDGLETNDPLTNLNSGLSTNLVLGLNSIAEVTVNTLSYSVDQGRYGASQVNYVTKSGTNQFHGNLYELWNGSKFNAADFFHQRHARQSQAAIDRESFRRQPGRADPPRQAVFLFRQRMGADRACPSSRRPPFPLRRFRNTSCSNCRSAARTPSPDQAYPPRRNWCRSIRRCSRFTETPAERRSRCWAVRSTSAAGSLRQSAERKWLRQSPKRFAFQRRSRTGADRSHRLQHQREKHGLVSLSG